MLHIFNICWTWVVFLLKISYAFAVLIAEKWGVRCRTCSQLTRVPGVAYNCVCSFKRRGMGPAKRHATMMTPSAFQQWCRTLALAPSTCDLLASLRTSQPVRRVTSRAHNVSGAHLSSKMGVTIQFESHKVELWAILGRRCRATTTPRISWSCAKRPSALKNGKPKLTCTGWLHSILFAINTWKMEVGAVRPLAF